MIFLIYPIDPYRGLDRSIFTQKAQMTKSIDQLLKPTDRLLNRMFKLQNQSIRLKNQTISFQTECLNHENQPILWENQSIPFYPITKIVFLQQKPINALPKWTMPSHLLQVITFEFCCNQWCRRPILSGLLCLFLFFYLFRVGPRTFVVHFIIYFIESLSHLMLTVSCCVKYCFVLCRFVFSFHV